MKTFCSIFLLVSFSFYGCAAILSGGNMTTVNCASDPSGAKVYANGNLVGTTPATAQVDKRKDQMFEFRKDGYETRTQMVTSSVGAGWVVADIFLGGIIGIVIDAATGSWMHLDQEMISVALDKK